MGEGAAGGYRGHLSTNLTLLGYNLDYVGNENGNPDPSIPNFDTNHEGHSGWRIDQIDANIERWLDLIDLDPDVILLHIGTNDFGQNYQTFTAINRLNNLMSKLCTLVPYGHQIVTNLLERTGPDAAIQSEFNPFVQEKVNGQVASGCRVTYLDMRSYVPLSDMPGKPLVVSVFCVHGTFFSNLIFASSPPSPLLPSRWPSSK